MCLSVNVCDDVVSTISASKKKRRGEGKSTEIEASKGKKGGDCVGW